MEDSKDKRYPRTASGHPVHLNQFLNGCTIGVWAGHSSLCGAILHIAKCSTSPAATSKRWLVFLVLLSQMTICGFAIT